MNRTHTHIDVENGSFISLPKDGTDYPPVNADINNLITYGKTTGGEGTPDNPIPLVNVSELDITSCGKNLFNEATITSGKYIYHIDGSLGNSSISDVSDWIRVVPSAKIYVSGHANGTSQFIGFYTANKAYITTTYSLNGEKAIPESCYFLRISFAKLDIGTLQVELGSTPTPYTPYQGKTYPYLLEDTDGVLHTLKSLPDGTRDEADLDGGESVDRVGSKIFDGSEAFAKRDANSGNGYACFQWWIGDSFFHFAANVGICDRFALTTTIGIKTQSCFRITNFLSSTYESIIQFWVPESTASTASEFKTWLSNNNTKVLYKRATPLPYQIKKYGETYEGVVWNYNQKPKSLQYHTNIFTDKNITMQCEVRKLGNRAMGEFYWVTENGDKIIAENGDYILLEY